MKISMRFANSMYFLGLGDIYVRKLEKYWNIKKKQFSIFYHCWMLIFTESYSASYNFTSINKDGLVKILILKLITGDVSCKVRLWHDVRSGRQT